jgi:hypothetical protein
MPTTPGAAGTHEKFKPAGNPAVNYTGCLGLQANKKLSFADSAFVKENLHDQYLNWFCLL